MRGKYELPFQFSTPQFLDDMIGDKSIVEIILWLIKNERILVIQ